MPKTQPLSDSSTVLERFTVLSRWLELRQQANKALASDLQALATEEDYHNAFSGEGWSALQTYISDLVVKEMTFLAEFNLGNVACGELSPEDLDALEESFLPSDSPRH